MTRRLWSTLLFASTCAIPGALVGGYVSTTAIGEGWEYFWVAAVLAGFLAGAGVWWMLAARRDRYSTRRGAWIGALAGVVGHPVCWYLYILAFDVCHWTTGGCVSSLGEAPAGPMVGLAGAFVFSFWSWLLFGWATVPLGAFAGAAVGRHYADRPAA